MNGFNISGVISLKDAFSAAAARVSASAKAMQANLAGVQAQAGALAASTNAKKGGLLSNILPVSPGLAGGVALGASIYKAITAYSDLQDAMAGVRKTANLTAQETDNMMMSLSKLSSQTVTSATSLAALAATGAQLGIDKDKLLEFTTRVDQIGVAFDMTGDQAASAFAKIKNTLGLTLDETYSLADAINHLSNNTAASASEIARSMTVFGGTAKVLGMSARNAAALATSLIETGRFPEMVGRGLNSILMKLASVADAGKQAVASMTDLGLSSTKVQEMAATKPLEALIAVLEKIIAMPIERRMGAIKNIFGQQWADEIVVLANNIDKLRSNLDLVSTADKFDGSVLAEFTNRMDTLAAKFDTLKNKVLHIATVLGSALQPVAEALLDAFIQVADAISWVLSKIGAVTSFLGFGQEGGLIANLSSYGPDQQAADMSNRQGRLNSFNNQPPGQTDVNVTGSVTINDQNGKQLGRAPLTKVGKNGAGRVNTGSGIGVGQDYGY